MRTQHQQLRFLLATAAVVLAALVGPMAAGAANDEFIPGVTDSTTGVLRERENRFIPGVTDSTTGVLRELERNRLEHAGRAGHSSDDASAFEVDVVVGAAFAALVAFAGLALLAVARRRRVAI